MSKLTLIAMASCALLLTACSSNPTHSLAIQKPNQQYEVTGVGKTALDAKNNAIRAANSTCGSRSAIMVAEKPSYHGIFKDVVSAETGQMIEAAAEVIGGLANSSLAGLNKNDRYQNTLTFYCQTK